MEELNEIYEYAKEHMEKSLEVLKKDFSTIRTGRVSTHIVDNIKVDYYGTPTPLNQVGSVIATDAQTITISPWEKNLLPDIEHAIQQANIGVNPNNDGETIKLFFPPMTVEQRQESAKQAKQMGEKAKIAIRNIRREIVQLQPPPVFGGERQQLVIVINHRQAIAAAKRKRLRARANLRCEQRHLLDGSGIG